MITLVIRITLVTVVISVMCITLSTVIIPVTLNNLVTVIVLVMVITLVTVIMWELLQRWKVSLCHYPAIEGALIEIVWYLVYGGRPYLTSGQFGGMETQLDRGTKEAPPGPWHSVQ